VGRSSILLSRFLVENPRPVGMTGGLHHEEKHPSGWSRKCQGCQAPEE
jgi:hypothetical protein